MVSIPATSGDTRDRALRHLPGRPRSHPRARDRQDPPVVVVSQNEMNRHLDTLVVCPLTTKLHPRWRSRVQAICAGRAAEIAVDQITTIGKERLGKRLDALGRLKAARVRRLITEMYGE